MQLSIIIVNYNVKYFLEQCLLSVRQAIENIEAEVFVVDNNSVDGSQKMLKERFPKVKTIFNKDNVGFAVANNQAIRQSTGKYVLLLNPDTVVEKDTFTKIIDFMDAHPDAGGLGVKMVDGKGRFLPESKRSLPTPAVSFYKIFGLSKLFPKSKKFGKYHLTYLDKDEIHEVEILAGAFMLMRKEALDKVGLLDETFFMYGEDIDLSYRLILGGYKNYYYPKTRIIHYKGESTKKGSLNYVYMFYNAMILFAKKHFSDKNIKLFSFLINCAIYFRAFLAILVRFIKKIILPVADFLFIYGGFLLIMNYWELSKFGAHGVFPEYFEVIIIPIYILIWLLSTNISGGYDKPIKPINLIKGIGFGTIFILIVYGLLNEDLRVSRFLIIIGAIWALFYLFLSRFILSKIKKSSIVFEKQAKKRIAIIGSANEVDRVNTILDQTGLRYGERVFVDVDKNNFSTEKFVGNLSQLTEIIRVHKINELIFCAKDIETSRIIDMMSDLSKIDLEYKIAPEESVSIIGSNSINTSGELYVIDINSIIKPTNKRNKRTLDVIVSLIFLAFSPILIFVTKRRLRLYADIFNVLFALKTWVGYYDKKEEYYSSLPKIKKGILSPMLTINKKVRDKVNPREVNILYAKNYKIKHDIDIILKGIRYI